jgi:Protein of unknown function (DUF3592)
LDPIFAPICSWCFIKMFKRGSDYRCLLLSDRRIRQMTNLARLYFPKRGNGWYWWPTMLIAIAFTTAITWVWEIQFEKVEGVLLSVSSRPYKVNRRDRAELFVSYRYTVLDRTYVSDQLYTSPFSRNWFLQNKYQMAELYASRTKVGDEVKVYVSRLNPKFCGLFKGGLSPLYFLAFLFSFPLTNAVAKQSRVFISKALTRSK